MTKEQKKKHDKVNEKITPVKIYSIFLNETHPFYDGNGRTCKILLFDET